MLEARRHILGHVRVQYMVDDFKSVLVEYTSYGYGISTGTARASYVKFACNLHSNTNATYENEIDFVVLGAFCQQLRVTQRLQTRREFVDTHLYVHTSTSMYTHTCMCISVSPSVVIFPLFRSFCSFRSHFGEQGSITPAPSCSYICSSSRAIAY